MIRGDVAVGTHCSCGEAHCFPAPAPLAGALVVLGPSHCKPSRKTVFAPRTTTRGDKQRSGAESRLLLPTVPLIDRRLNCRSTSACAGGLLWSSYAFLRREILRHLQVFLNGWQRVLGSLL